MSRATKSLFTSEQTSSAIISSPCRIVSVGKRRDGGMRFWCLEHRADATLKYGRRAASCVASMEPPIAPNDLLYLDSDAYRGGIALWGAVPPIYDTTSLPMDRGVHVHAREIAGGSKQVDRTYRAVVITGSGLPDHGIYISEIEAIYFMVASVFGYETKLVVCTHCGHPHLDKDYFSVHPHRRHLCAGCGKHFRDDEAGIGNPVCGVRKACGVVPRAPRSAERVLNIRQADFPGGIQIWGSNPALVWTGGLPEEEGIHVHAFKEEGYHPSIDETFSEVSIDGEHLDPVSVRTLMAQLSLPSLRGRVVALGCEVCKAKCTDQGHERYTPSAVRACAHCGREIRAKGHKRNVVSNPLLHTLHRLAEFAPRSPQNHDLNLRPETL